jgi:hypothetical protein
MTWALAPAEPETLDRYFLRELIWCGPCDMPMAPVLASSGMRYYGCPNERCARILVPAEVAEQQAWSRFVFLNEVLAHGVRRDRRHAALNQILRRLTVGSTTTDLGYEWRD